LLDLQRTGFEEKNNKMDEKLNCHLSATLKKKISIIEQVNYCHGGDLGLKVGCFFIECLGAILVAETSY